MFSTVSPLQKGFGTFYAFTKYQKLLINFFQACVSFINDNAVTKKAGIAKDTKSSELIARYCDILLRKTTGAEDPEDLLTNVVSPRVCSFE